MALFDRPYRPTLPIDLRRKRSECTGAARLAPVPITSQRTINQ